MRDLPQRNEEAKKPCRVIRLDTPGCILRTDIEEEERLSADRGRRRNERFAHNLMWNSVAAVERLWNKRLPRVNQVSTLRNFLTSNVANAALHLADVVERHISRMRLFVETVEV
jgi:hypothetical protein